MSETMHTPAIGSTTVHEEAQWSIVQAGIWVGRRKGVCIGVVEEQWGRGFVATTYRGVRIGEFPTLAEARRALAATLATA